MQFEKDCDTENMQGGHKFPARSNREGGGTGLLHVHN